LQRRKEQTTCVFIKWNKEKLEGESAEAPYIKVHEDKQYLPTGVEGTVAPLNYRGKEV
jgi:hypothetical protein